MLNRKIAFAALLALCAVSAFANNFRGADQVYIPVAAKTSGASGLFITDVYLSNLSNEEVDITVIFQPSGDNNTATPRLGVEFPNYTTLKGCTGAGCQGERKELKDIIAGLQARPEWAANGLPTQAFGLMTFNACKKGADCGPATQDEFGWSPNFRNITVQARVYSIPFAGSTKTTGQLLSGIPWYFYASSLSAPEGLDKLFVTGLTSTGTAGQAGTFRGNVGIANASQYSYTTIVLKLYKGTMSEADKKGETAVTLGPLGHVQRGLVGGGGWFPSAALDSGYFVTVEQTNNIATADAPDGCPSGCPGFLAYGSVIDNDSGDASTMEAQYLMPMDEDALLVLYPGQAGKPRLRRGIRH